MEAGDGDAGWAVPQAPVVAVACWVCWSLGFQVACLGDDSGNIVSVSLAVAIVAVGQPMSLQLAHMW